MSERTERKKSIWWKLALIAAAIAVLMALYYWLEATGRLGIFSSKDAFRDWLAQFGAWAPLIFILLQVAQVIVAFIPGEVTSVAGGLMFGFGWGIVLNIFGIALGSVIAFAVARKLGRPAVVKLAGGSATIDKYMDKIDRNSVWLLFMMFLLPFFPKDALCYVAGLTGVAWPVFVLISFFGRLPGQVMSALVGADIITVPIWGWVLIALGAAGLLYLSFRYSERIGDWLMGKMQKK
jgi:uncharacterized membrane protein YdjX (TVP38/TMEM64 family)